MGFPFSFACSGNSITTRDQNFVGGNYIVITYPLTLMTVAAVAPFTAVHFLTWSTYFFFSPHDQCLITIINIIKCCSSGITHQAACNRVSHFDASDCVWLAGWFTEVKIHKYIYCLISTQNHYRHTKLHFFPLHLTVQAAAAFYLWSRKENHCSSITYKYCE